MMNPFSYPEWKVKMPEPVWHYWRCWRLSGMSWWMTVQHPGCLLKRTLGENMTTESLQTECADCWQKRDGTKGWMDQNRSMMGEVPLLGELPSDPFAYPDAPVSIPLRPLSRSRVMSMNSLTSPHLMTFAE